MRYRLKAGLLAMLLSVSPIGSHIACASDHADMQGIRELQINSGKLYDFYMFKKDENLVLIVTTGTAFEQHKGVTINWDHDITYRFHLDYTSHVECEQSIGPKKHACDRVISKPDNILEDVFIDVNIGADGLSTKTFGIRQASSLRVTYGLYDDPFIRAGVNGKNTTAIAVSISLDSIPVHDGSGYFLGWVTSRHTDFGYQTDHIGQPYASQGIAPYAIPTNAALNTLHPNLHNTLLSTAPDVIILNPDIKSEFPNGRALEDDVVFKLAGENGPKLPSTSDKPFRNHFPYLASVHSILEHTDENP